MLNKLFDSSECGFAKKFSIEYEAWKKDSNASVQFNQASSFHQISFDTSMNNLLQTSATNLKISFENVPIDIIDATTGRQVVEVTNLRTFFIIANSVL